MEIIYENTQNVEYTDVLSNGLDEEAFKKLELSPSEFFGFYLKDDTSKIVGGITGYVIYGAVHIHMLWVHNSLRKHGYGQELLDEAQKLAVKKGCKVLEAETMSWQALAFYKKHGYKVDFERKGYPKDSSIYYLSKFL